MTSKTDLLTMLKQAKHVHKLHYYCTTADIPILLWRDIGKHEAKDITLQSENSAFLVKVASSIIKEEATDLPCRREVECGLYVQVLQYW